MKWIILMLLLSTYICLLTIYVCHQIMMLMYKNLKKMEEKILTQVEIIAELQADQITTTIQEEKDDDEL